MNNIFPLTLLLTYKMTGYMKKKKKSDVPDENLFASTNKISRKFMASATISWYSVAKPFFAMKMVFEANKESYCNHLKNSCFLQMKKLLSVMTGYLSKIVICHIDQIWYKTSLKKL